MVTKVPMVDAIAGPATPRQIAPVDSRQALKGGIAFAFTTLILVALLRNVNWDEFYFLSHVHSFLDGRLDRPMQTVFVHAFTWLDHVPNHEIGQIIAARFVMIGFLALTTASIYKIALHLTSQASALIAALAFLTSGFTLVYGGSFRADPMAAGLVAASIAILMTTPMKARHIIAAAALSAFAVLVTVKSALFAPAYLGVLIWRTDERGMAWRIFGAGCLSAAIAASLFLWHSSGITPAPGADTATNAREAVLTGLLSSGFFPRAEQILTWLVLSLGTLPLIIAGLLTVQPVRLRIALALFAAPVLAVIIYRNAFPYFFPFAVPLLMVSAALGADYLRRTRLLRICLLLMVVSGFGQAMYALREGTHLQRATLSEVHRIFPQPVSYIGDSGMVSSFPRVGFFMSGWGMQSYHAAGAPVFADLISTHQPPLLLANKLVLAHTMHTPKMDEERRFLLVEDHDLLRQSYVHYSGAIYLAGRDVQLQSEPVHILLPVRGSYRVVTSAAVTINGEVKRDGDVLKLGRIDLTIEGEADTVTRLIWDTGVELKPKALPRSDVYAPFWTFFR